MRVVESENQNTETDPHMKGQSIECCFQEEIINLM